jgi:molecular chaperone Hsp33
MTDPRTESLGQRDELLRATSSAGGLVVWALVGTDLVAEAIRRHQMSPTAGAALGRALMGAVLLAAGSKHGETVQLQFRGSGPLGTVVAIADPEGRVRGYASNPSANPPASKGRLDIGAAVGGGVLAVVRHRPGFNPYSGIVPLVSGTIAQDLAHYLAKSEQARTSVALGVFLDASGVEAAAGFLVHALPGASDEEIDLVEENVAGFSGPGELVREGLGARDIINRVLSDLGVSILGSTQPQFLCHCGRDRAIRTLSLLGEDELRSAADRAEVLEVRCEFCGEAYRLEPDELESLLRSTGQHP